MRFLNRVLDRTERRMFWIALLVFIAAFSLGAYDLIRPHVISVPTYGGTATEALVGTPKLINPLYAPLNDVDRDLAALIYSGLFRVDENLLPQPDLVDSYRWLDEGKTLEVSLRKDARFHDGAPVTSDDVLFTFTAAKNPNWRSPLASAFKGIRIVRVDDTTVQFQMDKTDPNLLVDLSLGILPAHLWEDVSETNASLAEANLRPIGSGPYQAVSFLRDSHGGIISYQLKRFEQYYGIQPYIDRWQFHFYPDRAQAENAAKSNQVDALAFVPWGEIDNVRNTTLHQLTLDLPQETVAFFRTSDPLLKEEKLRKVLQLAVDPTELQGLFGEHAAAISSPFPFLEATTTTKPDLEAARNQLTALGWVMKEGDTVRTQKTATTTMLAITIDVPNQPDLMQVADFLKRRWSLLGILVDVKTHDSEELLRDALTNRRYQVLLLNILLPPEQEILPYWSSEQARTGGYNFSDLQDAAVDQALKELNAVTTTEALFTARQKLSNAILAKTPALFLLRPEYAYLVSKQIKGTLNQRISRPADRLSQARDWYIKTKFSWR